MDRIGKEELYYSKGLNPLNFMSLITYINTHESFKLKCILEWCTNNPRVQLAEMLLSYISDNDLTDMENEYAVNHVPYIDFAERGKATEYSKYLGYSMYMIS